MAEGEVLADNDGAEEPTATSSVNGKQYDKFLKEFENFDEKPQQTAFGNGSSRDEGGNKQTSAPQNGGGGGLPV